MISCITAVVFTGLSCVFGCFLIIAFIGAIAAVITGHSDSSGSDEANNRMSLERADNAETYLVDTHGITGNRIDTASAGSSQPVGDNDTAEGRLQNRRIVVVVTIPAQ